MIPHWLKNAVIYQIYPHSFYDTNGDGIGDLNGIRVKLEYIKSLGVDAVWLNPCFSSSFLDAGYDVTDYYRIAPRYGSNQDMEKLIDTARELGLRILLDLVPGHTSIEHPWFRESLKGVDSEYGDCYIWMDRNYDKQKGPTEENYLKSFFPEQPALNYGYAEITEPWQQGIDAHWPQRNRAELRKIMKFWLDMGVSGFRVDMASSLIKNDPGYKETNRLWREVRSWLEVEYPDAVLISEWSWPEQAITAGFHVDFMIHFHKQSYKSLFFNDSGTFKNENGDCYFDAKGDGSPFLFIDEYMDQKDKIGSEGYISLPTGNHDFQRLVCGSRTVEQVKTAWVFLMTQPGIPVIYYGDEIGMRFLENAPPVEGSTLVGITAPNGAAVEGERAGARTPMQWNNTLNAGFSTAAPEKLYLPVDSEPDFSNVEEQEDNPSSMLSFVRNLIKIRKEYPTLGAESEIEFLNDRDVNYPLVLKRFDADSAFLVAVNPSGRDFDCRLDVDADKLRVVLESESEARLCDGKLSLSMRKFSYFVTELIQ